MIELLPLEIGAKRNVVPAVIPKRASGQRARLIAIEVVLHIAKRSDAARQVETRRSPVGGVLIIARDPGSSRDILAVLEVRHCPRRETAVLIASGQVQTRSEGMTPIDARVDGGCIGGVEEAEQIGIVRSSALVCKGAVDLIVAVECPVDARLQAVLVGVADKRNLVVVPHAAVEIRKGVQFQEFAGLVAD